MSDFSLPDIFLPDIFLPDIFLTDFFEAGYFLTGFFRGRIFSKPDIFLPNFSKPDSPGRFPPQARQTAKQSGFFAGFSRMFFADIVLEMFQYFPNIFRIFSGCFWIFFGYSLIFSGSFLDIFRIFSGYFLDPRRGGDAAKPRKKKTKKIPQKAGFLGDNLSWTVSQMHNYVIPNHPFSRISLTGYNKFCL